VIVAVVATLSGDDRIAPMGTCNFVAIRKILPWLDMHNQMPG
jgi:hypothetical protein